MPRNIVIPVTDERVEYVQIRGFEKNHRGGLDFVRSVRFVTVPEDDQLAQDLLEAISIVENSWWSHRHQLAARLRTAFGLDKEDDS